MAAVFSNNVVMALTFLILAAAGYGCPPSSGTDTSYTAPGTTVTYSKAGEDQPTLSVDRDRHVLAKRSVRLTNSDVISVENFFLNVDGNDDGLIDACDWLKSPYVTRVKDYTDMLADLDLNGDDVLTLDEFKRVKIVTTKM